MMKMPNLGYDLKKETFLHGNPKSFEDSNAEIFLKLNSERLEMNGQLVKTRVYTSTLTNFLQN